MNKRFVAYFLNIVLFLMWWAFFAAMINWWVGLIGAAVITSLQYVYRKLLP